ncbi:MAG: DUF2779 domain-containing protein [Clostridia bacterium]|nr:DUF2779 domain-containing protein [Clostridia bacterium]
MISKSTFQNYMQCPKLCWLSIHKPGEAEPPARDNRANGILVGELAKTYFLGTADCTRLDAAGKPLYAEQIAATKAALLGGAEAIAEAAFSVGGLYCAVDILKRDVNAFSIYEVKSALTVKEKYLTDVAFQKYVLEQAGATVEHIYIMHPDKQYALHGALDVRQYFAAECVDVNKTVTRCLDELPALLPEIEKTIAAGTEPAMDFCRACKDCPFNRYCTRDIPEDCVGSLSGIGEKAYDYYNKGILTIADYAKTKEYAKSTRRARIQAEKVLAQDDTVYVDKTALKEFLDRIEYPVYHLDFETTQKPIPEFEGFHPDESYPFQYSLHIEAADGTLNHREFLGDEENCVRALAEQLVRDIPAGSRLMAYNASTEKNIIKDLARRFPDLAPQLLELSSGFIDLLEPFKKGYYYDPKQKGSNSIKEVMPALCPAMAEAYHRLPVVHNGYEALSMFPRLIALKGMPEYAAVRKGMLAYCELDTRSMVEILKVLRAAI